MNAKTFFMVGLTVFALLPLWLGGQAPTGHEAVQMQGVRPQMKFEAPVQGFLRPVNGKLKLRATEVVFEPGGVLGDHYHSGPGIRLVLEGEVTVAEAVTVEKVAHAGEYFYESGDQSQRLQNRSTRPAKLLVVELLPGSWQGPAMVPLSRRPELEQLGGQLQELLCPAR